MELGYITFSSKEQELVHKVLQQLTEGAIDELGLGRIRDAFSDEMFPGMSTLHRRSKYFVLLPALYNQISKTPINQISKKSSNDIRKDIASLIRKWEINMTISLLNYANQNSLSTDGITGNSIGIDRLRSGEFVKIRPTTIYLSSLKTFGLVSDRMNLIDLIYQQLLINESKGRKKIKKVNPNEADKRREKDEYEDPDDTNDPGNSANFGPFASYDFSEESAISLQLTAYEAQILKQKIIGRCSKEGKDNLYSYILKHDSISIENDYFKMKDIVDGFRANCSDLKKVYNMAYDFSKWAHLMNTYYRYAFYRKKDEKKARNQLEHIKEIIEENDYPSKERMGEIIDYVTYLPTFNDVNGLGIFCKKSSELIGNKNAEEDLISLIANREKQIKRNHYKIGNEKYKDTDFAELPGYYTYRWNEIVYSMINDIRNPYNK